MGPEGSIVQMIVTHNSKLIAKMREKGYNPDAPAAEQKAWWAGQTKNKYEKGVIIATTILRNQRSKEFQEARVSAVRRVQEGDRRKPQGRFVVTVTPTAPCVMEESDYGDDWDSFKEGMYEDYASLPPYEEKDEHCL
ncbi:hypothetical protein scyTo_0000389 [Scyliorhinus torazame]|uniref:Uncharacterized protein n=1 Tax=Scyliorhinus torazame TaxID=75743 RepID=A0A401NWC8_SCYTO|nr:hypothetical protein [Scyliorhinus torazame]